jgi:hypothetical protein
MSKLRAMPNLTVLSPARILLGVCIVLVLILLEGTYPLLGFVPEKTSEELRALGAENAKQINSQMKGKSIITPNPDQVYQTDITWAVSARLKGYMWFFCATPEPAAPADTKKEDEDPNSPSFSTAGSPCKVENAMFSSSAPPEAFIRWDRFLFVVGLLALCVVALLYLNRIVLGMNVLENPSRVRSFPAYTNLEQHLLEDVQRAFERGDALFARSSLMLIAGILVAFLGIVAFAFLTSAPVEQNSIFDFPRFGPEGGGGPTITFDQIETARRDGFFYGIIRSFTSNFRFVLIFIFVETVAWFLLKQYRALIEDYKAFYRIYLRRQNYASSYFMLKDRSLTQSAEILVSASMLNEDLSGALPKGQEVESRAQLEFAERNSFSAIANFIERIGQIGQSAAASLRSSEQEPRHKAASPAKEPH